MSANGHLLARIARQHLVHDGDRPDPALGLPQGLLRFTWFETARLQPQERRDGLKVVLHPVVNLADRRVLREKKSVETAQVRHVPHEDHPAGDR